MKKTRLKRKTGLRKKAVKKKRSKPYTGLGQCSHNRRGRCKKNAIDKIGNRRYCGTHWRVHKKEKLGELVREIVLKRDIQCVRCGSRYMLEKSHIVPVSKSKQLEFEILNVKTLCHSCHIYWWHKDILDAAVWAREHFGNKRINWLNKQAESRRGQFIDLDAIEAYLKAAFNKLEG